MAAPVWKQERDRQHQERKQRAWGQVVIDPPENDNEKPLPPRPPSRRKPAPPRQDVPRPKLRSGTRWKLDEFPAGHGSQSVLEMMDPNNECEEHGRCPFDSTPPCGCFPIERTVKPVPPPDPVLVFWEPPAPSLRRARHRVGDELLHRLYVRHLRGESARSLAAELMVTFGYNSLGAARNCLIGGWRTRGLAPMPRQAAAAEALTARRHPDSPGIENVAEYDRWQRRKAGRQRQCAGSKTTRPKLGRRCEGWAMEGSDFCHQHHPDFAERRAEHLRQARARRKIERKAIAA